MAAPPAGLDKASETPPAFDTTVPNSARVWNYWLGGKDCFQIDREFGEKIFEAYPGILDDARASRAFLVRAVRYLIMETNIRQFLDIGTGLPIMDNTHEVAQRLARESRVVYVDNDPMVLAHARALLVSTPEGATAYVAADVRDPDQILAAAAETLDFTRPIAVILSGLVGHIADGEAQAIVKRLVGALPSGSHVAIADVAVCGGTAEVQDLFAEIGYTLRTPEQIAGFFDGLDLLEPGVVPVALWRPEKDAPPVGVGCVGGVGRKL